MRPDKDDRAYLWDMLTAAVAVSGFVQGRTLDEYVADLNVAQRRRAPV
jgi:uncharacterized protein with HEPN domain